MGNAHCINEQLNFLPSYRLSCGKMATLYIIHVDIQFVDVISVLLNYILIFCSNKMCIFDLHNPLNMDTPLIRTISIIFFGVRINGVQLYVQKHICMYL